MTAWINDRFIPLQEAVLQVGDMSIQRGYAVFDFFRAVNGKPLFLSDHLDRFFASALAMYLPVLKTREELTAIVLQLLQQSSLPEAGIRIMLTGGYAIDTYTPTIPNLVITCQPIRTASMTDFENGYRVISCEHQRELPHIKSINYLTAVWLQPLLKEKQADDVLYHHQGIVSEFPRSNVFIVTKDHRLLTPARHMLKGITRKKVIELAAAIVPAEERDIYLEELYNAAEIFLTSTSKKIIPVISVDGKSIADGKPGPLTKEIFQRFLEAEKNL